MSVAVWWILVSPRGILVGFWQGSGRLWWVLLRFWYRVLVGFGAFW